MIVVLINNKKLSSEIMNHNTQDCGFSWQIKVLNRLWGLSLPSYVHQSCPVHPAPAPLEQGPPGDSNFLPVPFTPINHDIERMAAGLLIFR